MKKTLLLQILLLFCLNTLFAQSDHVLVLKDKNIVIKNFTVGNYIKFEFSKFALLDLPDFTTPVNGLNTINLTNQTEASGNQYLADSEANVEFAQSFQSYVLNLEELTKTVSLAKSVGKTIVFTNGCFDLIHGGHIEFLQKAREKGDLLIVGLNSDQSVKSIKGNDRPIKTQKERANIISALKSVDYITIFNETTPEEIIRQVRPDILVKGDDYDINKVVGREIVEGYGAKVELIPIVKGLSTTNIVEKILKSYKTEETT